MSSPAPPDDLAADTVGQISFILLVNLGYICISIMKLGFQLLVLGEMPDASELSGAATAIAVMQVAAIVCAISGMFTLLTKGHLHLLHTFFAFALGPIFLTTSYAIHTTVTLKKKETILSTCSETASTLGGLRYIMGSWGIHTARADPIPDPTKWCFQTWHGEWELSLWGLIMVTILAALGICITLSYIWFQTKALKGAAPQDEEQNPPVYYEGMNDERQLLLEDMCEDIDK